MNPRMLIVLRFIFWLTFVIGIACFLAGISILYLEWYGWPQ